MQKPASTTPTGSRPHAFPSTTAIAQAQAEGIPLVGRDRMFAAYDLHVIW